MATVSSSLSLKLAFTFSVAFSSFSLASPSPSPSRSSSKPYPLLSLKPYSSSFSPSPPPRSLAADLLALLGGHRAAAAVPASEDGDLRSCLRFLVPFPPSNASLLPRRCGKVPRRDLLAGVDGGAATAADEMVWWPPEPVIELAQLAVFSGGDPAEIQRLLDPSMLPVPEDEGLKKDKCKLTRTPYGRRFANEELNSYLAFLFELIATRGPSAGLNVSLNRYDLFHGHIFLATGTGRLGIL